MRKLSVFFLVLTAICPLFFGNFLHAAVNKQQTTPDATAILKNSINNQWLACFRGQNVAITNSSVPDIQVIYPDVLPHQQEPPYLSARLTSPIYDFKFGTDGDTDGNENGTKRLAACYSLGEDNVFPITIRSIEHNGKGTALIKLDLPRSGGFSWFKACPRCEIDLMVISEDGNYLAEGKFQFVSRLWAFFAATLLTVVVFCIFIHLRCQPREDTDNKKSLKSWCLGLFIGQDGQPSLSLFQIFIWTVLTLWSLLFVLFNTGNLLTMTTQVMMLLGFAGVGSLTARWIATGRQLSQAPAEKDSNAPRFSAMLEVDGRLDLFKVQLLLFTVFIAGYVAFRILKQSAFPELDPQFLLLMGVSNGLYVGTKFTQSSPLALAGARKIELDALLLRQTDLSTRKEELLAELDILSTKLSDPELAQSPAVKESLESKKRILESEINECKDEEAKVNVAVDAKSSEYKLALQSATQS